MKKNIFLSLFATMIIIIISSCKVTNETISLRTMDIKNTGIVQNPVIVDLEIDGKRAVYSEDSFNFDIETVKKKIVAHLLDSLNADILIEPIYTTTHKRNKIIVKVTGYPAKYKNFRNLKKEDIEVLKLRNIVIDKTTYKEPEKQLRKGGK